MKKIGYFIGLCIWAFGLIGGVGYDELKNYVINYVIKFSENDDKKNDDKKNEGE